MGTVACGRGWGDTMQWYQDAAGRWYIAEQDGTTRWPTAEEERARAQSSAGPQGAQSFARTEPHQTYQQTMPMYASEHPRGNTGQPAANPRRSFMLPLGTGLAGLLLGGILGASAAGSGGTEAVTTSSGQGSNAAPASSSARVSSPAPAKPAAREETNPAFGQVATFKDKSTLTCGKPASFKRAQFAAGGEQAKVFLKVKCTFTNRSGETFEPALTTLSMSAAGAEGESVYQEGLDAPDNPVLNGKSVTWWSGYGVEANKEVQVSVKVGFLDYPTITFS